MSICWTKCAASTFSFVKHWKKGIILQQRHLCPAVHCFEYNTRFKILFLSVFPLDFMNTTHLFKCYFKLCRKGVFKVVSKYVVVSLLNRSNHFTSLWQFIFLMFACTLDPWLILYTDYQSSFMIRALFSLHLCYFYRGISLKRRSIQPYGEWRIATHVPYPSWSCFELVWPALVMRNLTPDWLFCITAFNSVLPSGGYSEMACSQMTPTLWVLLGLT